MSPPSPHLRLLRQAQALPSDNRGDAGHIEKIKGILEATSGGDWNRISHLDFVYEGAHTTWAQLIPIAIRKTQKSVSQVSLFLPIQKVFADGDGKIV